MRRGRIATVQRWLARLPDDVITANPPMALLAAWGGGLGTPSEQDNERGRAGPGPPPEEEIERWLAAAETGDYRGPPPQGMSSVAFGAALVRAVNTFDDVARSLRAARRAVDAAAPRTSESYWSGVTALGRSLYLSGRAAEARALLEDVASHGPAPGEQPFVVVTALALLSLLAGEDGDDEQALQVARHAMDVAEAQGVRYGPLTGVAYIALGRSTARHGGRE